MHQFDLHCASNNPIHLKIERSTNNLQPSTWAPRRHFSFIQLRRKLLAGRADCSDGYSLWSWRRQLSLVNLSLVSPSTNQGKGKHSKNPSSSVLCIGWDFGTHRSSPVSSRVCGQDGISSRAPHLMWREIDCAVCPGCSHWPVGRAASALKAKHLECSPECWHLARGLNVKFYRCPVLSGAQLCLCM